MRNVENLLVGVASFVVINRRARERHAAELLEARSGVQRLEQVAWRVEPADAVRGLLGMYGAERYAVRRDVDNLPLGAFLYIAASWAVVVAALLTVSPSSQVSFVAVIVSGLLVVLAELFMLIGGIRLKAQWERDDAVLVACVRFSLVLVRSDSLAGAPTSIDARRDLANSVDLAAQVMTRASFVSSRITNMGARRHALAALARTSTVLRSYCETALWGGPDSLRAMADDFGRAALRVATGNWEQIVELRPERATSPRRIVPPFLSDLREIVVNLVKVGLPAIAVAAGSAWVTSLVGGS